MRAVVTDLGLKIAATELGIAHDAAHTALEAAQFATTEADGKLRDAALAAFDGNKHPHQAVEVAERTEVQYDPRRAVEIAMYQGWTNCLQIKAREFDRRAIAMAEARAKVPALLGEAVPEIDFQVRDMLTLEGVEIVKAPMVKVSRDLSEWATPADQLSLPIEEEASIE